jgi:hypothetical protein
MIKNFITTLEIYPEDLNTKIQEHLLNKLRTKFNNTCLEGYFIKKVIDITKRGALVSPRNDFSGILICDIQFSAECIMYEIGDLIVVTVSKIEEDSIVCTTSEYILYLKIDLQRGVQIGSRFICVIRNISYDVGHIISMTASLYKPCIKTLVNECINADLNDLLTQSLNLCITKIKTLLQILETKPFAKKIANMLTLNGKVKMGFDKYKCIDEFNYNAYPQDNILFIINPYDIIHNGIFRIAPHNTPENLLNKDCDFILRKDAGSLQAVLYKYSASICNYLEVLIEFGNYESENEFNKNENIWQYYKTILKN